MTSALGPDDPTAHPQPPEPDGSLVRRLVLDQFPQWSHLLVTAVVPGGVDNRTFRLGDELSVRLPAGPGYAAQVAKEQRWLPLLAERLPLPIPAPVGLGRPGQGYPFPWSVYRWIEGESAVATGVPDVIAFAADLARFLVALRRADPTEGPGPGEHCFFRGGSLATYEDETLAAIETLAMLGDSVGAGVDPSACRAVWGAATAPVNESWQGDPVWFRGDVAVGNLLVRDGRLAAVIDFGTCGVGDPACDLVIAWTLFEGDGRAAFRRTVDLDAGTWARARGWALWKALITLVGALDGGLDEDFGGQRDKVEGARHTVEAVLLDAGP